MLYWCLRFVGFFFRRLPVAFTYWLGLRALDMAYRWNRVARAIVRHHHAVVLQHQGIRPSIRTLDGLTRKTFQFYGKYLADFFRMGRLQAGEMEKTVSVQGWEAFERVARSGRGCIVLTAHVGNWELGGAYIASMGFPIHAVAAPVASKTLDRLFAFERRHRGLRLIPWERAALATYKTLRGGGMVAMLADRDFTGTGTECEFLGRKTRLPRGPVWLARRANVPICMGFVTRADDDTFLLKMLPPLDPAEGLSEEEMQAQVVRGLEEAVRRNPCQWFDFSPLWPEDEKFVALGREKGHRGKEEAGG